MFMSVALIASFRGTCLRNNVGAVLVKNNRIIGVGYSGSPSGAPHCLDEGCIIKDEGCIRTLHAETNCLLDCAKRGASTLDSTLFVTISPCLACAKIIVSGGIKEVVYLKEYRDKSGLDFLSQSGVCLYFLNDLFPGEDLELGLLNKIEGVLNEYYSGRKTIN